MADLFEPFWPLQRAPERLLRRAIRQTVNAHRVFVENERKQIATAQTASCCGLLARRLRETIHGLDTTDATTRTNSMLAGGAKLVPLFLQLKRLAGGVAEPIKPPDLASELRLGARLGARFGLLQRYRCKRQELYWCLLVRGVTYGHASLGDYRVLIDTSSLRISGESLTEPLADSKAAAAGAERTRHAHIDCQGDICFGAHDNLAESHSRQGLVVELLLLAQRLLDSPYADSAFESPSYWMAISPAEEVCRLCDDSLDEDSLECECGRTVCTNCAGTCNDCDETHCANCLSRCCDCHCGICCGTECASADCSRMLCSGCTNECAACASIFCAECTTKCCECSKTFCSGCIDTCACGDDVCDDCREDCDGCKTSSCPGCHDPCTRCRCRFCAECLTDGRCAQCVIADDADAATEDDAAPADPVVAAVNEPESNTAAVSMSVVPTTEESHEEF